MTTPKTLKENHKTNDTEKETDSHSTYIYYTTYTDTENYYQMGTDTIP